MAVFRNSWVLPGLSDYFQAPPTRDDWLYMIINLEGPATSCEESRSGTVLYVALLARECHWRSGWMIRDLCP